MVRLSVIPSPHVKHAMNLMLSSFRSQYTPDVLHQPFYEPTRQSEFYSEPQRQPQAQPGNAQSTQYCNMTPAEWDVLFYAVLARLEQCINDEPGTKPDTLWQHASKSTKTSVLGCAADLRQLHDALMIERAEHAERKTR